MVLRAARVIVVLAAAGCTRQAVDLMGRLCESGDCTDGFVCNPLTQSCAPPVLSDCTTAGAVCPITTQDYDPCDSPGSFLPCSEGTVTCDNGCRLCQGDYTWSACNCTGLNCACYPSNHGVEVCDGFDNDCNGHVDDGDPIEGCIDSWLDGDHDGFGAGEPYCYCGVPVGRSRIGGDPDDGNPAISPDAGELCDGIDNNADGSTLEREIDNDGDGYVECNNWIGATPGVLGGGDCDDSDDKTFPSAPTELCDGVANKCGAIPANELDGDSDGYVGCSVWEDRHLLYPDVRGGGDCGPSDVSVHPGALDVFDSKDNDCDGKSDECLADCDCGAQLVSCYPLGSLPTAEDLGPAGVNASPQSGSGSTLIGVVGLAYALTSSYYVEGPSSAAQDVSHFTLSVFVRATNLPSGSTVRQIVDVQSEYGIQLEKNGNMTCYFANGSTTYVTVGAAAALSAGSWQHVGCTYDGAALKLYAAGVEVGSKPTSNAVRLSKTGALRIGSNSPESGNTGLESFEGGIDQFKIFNQALSKQQMCVEAHLTNCPP